MEAALDLFSWPAPPQPQEKAFNAKRRVDLHNLRAAIKHAQWLREKRLGIESWSRPVSKEEINAMKRNERTDAAVRLREWADVLDIPSGTFVNDDLRWAAEEIERLRMALKPFSEVPPGGYGPADRMVAELPISLTGSTKGSERVSFS